MRAILANVAILSVFCSPCLADDVLRVGVFGLPRGMGNPFSSTAISEMHTWAAIFDGLTRVDGNGRVHPALAVSWHSIDEHTWRFELRRDVRFSNGEPFDAAAVVATVSYLLSDEAAGQSVSREFTAIRSAAALASYTLEIQTHQPTIILPALMAAMRIVAPAQWHRLGPAGFAQEPVGTGPFAVHSWTAARVELTAFKESWRAPQVDRLELYEILDPSARRQGVESRRLDIALALSSDDLSQLERSGAHGHASAGGGVTSLTFITEREGPLQDRRVRQALNYAVDKQSLVDVLLGGLTRPAGQPVPHYAVGFNPEVEPYPYDPQRARTLLAEAGYPGGFEFIAEVVPSGPHSNPAFYAFIAQQLAQVGVDLEVRGIPASQLISKAVNGNFVGSAFAMTFDSKPYLDGQRAISMHSCLRAVPWHCDRQLMPQIEAIQTEFDPARREDLLKEIMRAYHDDPPALYLFEAVYIDGVDRRVRNYSPVNGIINYEQIRLVD
jgi:peptide/nickel transport system substrate-binding protein